MRNGHIVRTSFLFPLHYTTYHVHHRSEMRFLLHIAAINVTATAILTLLAIFESLNMYDVCPEKFCIWYICHNGLTTSVSLKAQVPNRIKLTLESF